MVSHLYTLSRLARIEAGYRRETRHLLPSPRNRELFVLEEGGIRRLVITHLLFGDGEEEDLFLREEY